MALTENLSRRFGLGHLRDGFISRIHGPVSKSRFLVEFPPISIWTWRWRTVYGTADYVEVDQFVQVRNAQNFIGDDRFQVFIKNLFLFIGDFLEALEGLIEMRLAEFVSQGLDLLPESMAARVFTQNQSRLGDAHGFRPHDFISGLLLEHSVLMDTRSWRKHSLPQWPYWRDENPVMPEEKSARGVDLFR